MKKIIFVLLLIVIAACNHAAKSTPAIDKKKANKIDTAKAAKISFSKPSFNFGTLKNGDSIEHDYKFINTGLSPLVIKDAVGSCGCTQPRYSHRPIAPGDSGIIKVFYNSKYGEGEIAQAVTITSNALPAEATLYLSGKVIVPKKHNAVK